jgi:signal transduction histidine kinase
MSIGGRQKPASAQAGAEPEGARRDERLATILKLSREGMILLERDGAVQECNAAASRIALSSVVPLRGTMLLQIWPCFAPVWAAWSRLDAADPARDGMFTAISRDGRPLNCELALAGDTIVLVLHEAVSAPQRTLSNQQAGFVQMARQSGMSAIGTAMAHELNQPLTAMLLYLQTMQRMLTHSHPDFVAIYGEFIGKSVREAQRAAEIVKRIRDLAARKEPSRRLVNLEAVIDEAIELACAGRPSSIGLIRAYTSTGMIRIDAVEVQQVLVNLLSNAFDAVAGTANGTVTVTTLRDGGTARVLVSDTGPGISPQLIARLFRPFESTKEKGLGIGLSISQAIAHAHGGDLTVDPGGRGKGATFILSLPQGEDDQGAPRAYPSRTSGPARNAQNRAIKTGLPRT